MALLTSEAKVIDFGQKWQYRVPKSFQVVLGKNQPVFY
jgi:hypothetical protein